MIKWLIWWLMLLPLELEMTELQRFLDGFGAIYNAIYFRFDLQDNIDRCAFFYEINIGWYNMYNPDDMEEISGKF